MIIGKKATSDDTQKKSDCEAVLRRFAVCEEAELFASLKSGREGISAALAEEKLDETGPNIIVTGKEKGTFGRLFKEWL